MSEVGEIYFSKFCWEAYFMRWMNSEYRWISNEWWIMNKAKLWNSYAMQRVGSSESVTYRPGPPSIDERRGRSSVRAWHVASKWPPLIPKARAVQVDQRAEAPPVGMRLPAASGKTIWSEHWAEHGRPRVPGAAERVSTCYLFGAIKSFVFSSIILIKHTVICLSIKFFVFSSIVLIKHTVICLSN